MLDSIGTAEGLLVCLDQPVDDVTMGGQGFTQGAHVVPDQYYGLGAIYTAGASYEWARQAVGGGRSHDELLAGARSIPAGSLGVMFLPHLRLAMFPELDSRARGAFVGLTTDMTSDALIRSVLEGVAMEGRAGFGPLARYAQLPKLTDIKVIGGTSRNQLLIEIKASVMNARHHVLEIPEATALGAAMLAGMASGVYRSADDAIASIQSAARVVERRPGCCRALRYVVRGDLPSPVWRTSANASSSLRPVHFFQRGWGCMSYLGIDLGTTSLKAVLVSVSGEVLREGTASYAMQHPYPGAAVQDPEHWWRATRDAVQQIQNGIGAEINAIGLSGQMHGTVCLNSMRQLIRPALIWPDTRGTIMAAELTAVVGEMRLSDTIGTPLASGFQGVTVAWLRQHEPTTWRLIATVLLPKDYLRFRLTGEMRPTRVTPPAPVCSTSIREIGRISCSIPSGWIGARCLRSGHRPRLRAG